MEDNIVIVNDGKEINSNTESSKLIVLLNKFNKTILMKTVMRLNQNQKLKDIEDARILQI